MAGIQIKQYNPFKPGQAPRIDDSDWKQHEGIIRMLHLRKYTRKQILNVLKNNYNFHPSSGQLKFRMTEWDLKVYKIKLPPIPASSDIIQAPGLLTNNSANSILNSVPLEVDLEILATPPNDLVLEVEDPDTIDDEEFDSITRGDVLKNSNNAETFDVKKFVDHQDQNERQNSSDGDTSPMIAVQTTSHDSFVHIAPSVPPVVIREQSACLSPPLSHHGFSHAVTSNSNSYGRDSQSSDFSVGSSMRNFKNLARRIRLERNGVPTMTSRQNSFSNMSIDSRASLTFAAVTGMGGSISDAMSITSSEIRASQIFDRSSRTKSVLHRRYSYFRFQRGNQGWVDCQRDEIDASQQHIEWMVAGCDVSNVKNQLMKMGLSRRKHIETLQEELNHYETGGLTWDIVLIQNTRVKMRSSEKFPTVMEFDIIFRLKIGQRVPDLDQLFGPSGPYRSQRSESEVQHSLADLAGLRNQDMSRAVFVEHDRQPRSGHHIWEVDCQSPDLEAREADLI